MTDWVCYLIVATDSAHTYIGATNNFIKRLQSHNDTRKNRKGAKYTLGKHWMPLMIVSGFNGKRECLSFESGWKKLAKNRKNSRAFLTNNNYLYTKDTHWNRTLDLFYFMHHFSLVGTHFKLHSKIAGIVLCLTIHTYNVPWINQFNFPSFVTLTTIK